MKKNKKVVLLFVFVLCIGILSGCEKSKYSQRKKNQVEDRYRVVCTIFPQYDWVKEIIGEHSQNYDLTLLLEDGVDLHSYQPTATDIATIVNSDLFIYVGGESDEWVQDVLKKVTNKDMVVLNLLDILGEHVKEEEHVEGMETEAPEVEEEESVVEYDEHIWLSLRNAVTCCNAIRDALCQLDTKHASSYKQNGEQYVSELQKLDESYENVIKNAMRSTLLFGDRFPFRYLIDDYGLTYYAAFAGCSAETEASFETIVFLASKVDEEKLPAVLTIDQSDQKIAQTIIQNTKNKNQKVLTLDSMQSVTGESVKSGTTYLSVMENNLGVLKQALN